MGWASGSDLAAKLVKSAREHFPDDEARRAFYSDLIDGFEEMDCDTLYEVVEGGDSDPVFAAELRKRWD
jgi:Golgi nucleoside diphosphatase